MSGNRRATRVGTVEEPPCQVTASQHRSLRPRTVLRPGRSSESCATRASDSSSPTMERRTSSFIVLDWGRAEFEELREGDEVEFQTRPGEKGPQAFNVKLR